MVHWLRCPMAFFFVYIVFTRFKIGSNVTDPIQNCSKRCIRLLNLRNYVFLSFKVEILRRFKLFFVRSWGDELWAISVGALNPIFVIIKLWPRLWQTQLNIFAFLSVACQHGIINVEYEETNQVFIVTKLSQTRRCVAKKNFLSIDFEFQRFSYSLTYLQWILCNSN